MERLSLLNAHFQSELTGASNFKDTWNLLRMNDFMSEKGMQLKDATEKLMRAECPNLLKYYNSTDFPFFMVDKLKTLGISGLDMKGIGGPELPTFDMMAISYELARWDASVATFMIVQNGLGMHTIYHLGNEEQK
mmetsp:Transcript_41863/g.30738  ORF Transcript_41863/g.30738 Transcript_41863/m.30738 type:complete len:135 (+) Transcript_41863:9-413(+)